MDPNNRRIIFHTNRIYLKRLVPERYQENGGHTEPECIFTLKNKANRSTLENQTIVIDVDILRALSQDWYIIVPTLPGSPELDIDLSSIPASILPAIETIIRNIGHIGYFDLVGPYIGDDDDDMDPIPPENARALEENHLQPPTSTSRIIIYLQKICNEEEGADEGLWLPDERLNFTIEFLEYLLKWATSKPSNGKKFERATVEQNLVNFKKNLNWLQGKQKKRAEKRKQEIWDNRRQSKRLRQGAGHSPRG
jgi:hypothetical protein